LIYRKNDSELFFIHIPRTGGRFISQLLQANGYDKTRHGNELFHARELVHLDRKRYLAYYQTINNSFAVIRHPIERFISSLFVIHDTLKDIREIDDYHSFLYYMNEHKIVTTCDTEDFELHITGLSRMPNNWFTRQVDFIDDNTKLWKYHNRLDQDFIDWLNDQFNVDIVNRRVNLSERIYDNKIYDSISTRLANNVMRYYEEDFNLWNNI